MKANRTNGLVVMVVVGTLGIGCNRAEVEDPPVTPGQTALVSDCGGFEGTSAAKDPSDDYCDAERLEWVYDPVAEELTLVDERVILNCCGERGVALAVEDGVWVVTETDGPEGSGGRCDCLCTYDFRLDLTGVPQGEIPVRLVRDVTDEGSARVVWEGTIDLAPGVGTVVVDPEPVEYPCSMP